MNLIGDVDVEENMRIKDTRDVVHERNSRDYIIHKKNLQPKSSRPRTRISMRANKSLTAKTKSQNLLTLGRNIRQIVGV